MALPKNQLDPASQVRNSLAYDDTIAAGAAMAAPAGDNQVIEFDLNTLRSMMLKVVGLTNWYDAVEDLFNLKAIHDKKLAGRAPLTPGTADFTLGSTLGGVLVTPAMLGGAGTIAVGASSAEDGGYIAADESGFTVAGTLGIGTSVVNDSGGILMSSVGIINSATNNPIVDGSGREIFGLLQTLTGTADGAVVAANPAENLQISFVVYDPTTDTIIAATLDAATYHFAPAILRSFYSLTTGALMAESIVPDVVDSGGGLIGLAHREWDVDTLLASNTAITVTTGHANFTEYSGDKTTSLPSTGALFTDETRVKIWRNGQLQSKGASAAANRDVYWISATQFAFEFNVRPKDVIRIETAESY